MNKTLKNGDHLSQMTLKRFSLAAQPVKAKSFLISSKKIGNLKNKANNLLLIIKLCHFSKLARKHGWKLFFVGRKSIIMK